MILDDTPFLSSPRFSLENIITVAAIQRMRAALIAFLAFERRAGASGS